MKRKLNLIIGACAASVIVWPALAQETPARNPDRPEYTRDRMSDNRRTDRISGAAKADEIIGMTVKNNQGEKLGKVEELAVDVESGRVIQVILSVGGFIGMGDTLTAVPPGALHHDVAQKVLHLDANKDTLKNAPKFENSKWAEYSDSEHLSAVYRHFGQEPAFTFVQKEGSGNTTSTRKADGTWSEDRSLRDSQSRIPAARLAQSQKASKVVGMSVKNLQDEKLGKVENLMVDLPSGRIVAVIVSSGGFLGLGDELSAIPPTALGFNTEHDTLRLDASKDTLANSPHFKASQWPDFSEPSYVGGVYRAYKVDPYFATDTRPANDRRNVRDRDDRIPATTAPDNTARNVRDRDERTLTPRDQGNSQADLDTTAQIRKELVANKGLSVNAKNVKIISNNGRVTLRGPVNNAEEKRLISEIASRIARAENVDNQLEVKMTTSNEKPYKE